MQDLAEPVLVFISPPQHSIEILPGTDKRAEARGEAVTKLGQAPRQLRCSQGSARGEVGASPISFTASVRGASVAMPLSHRSQQRP
jgi:hypothetical protein